MCSTDVVAARGTASSAEKVVPISTICRSICSECVVNWWPYQAQGGCCPWCGGGTVRRQEPASDDADVLYQLACVQTARRERVAAFEAYYAEASASSTAPHRRSR